MRVHPRSYSLVLALLTFALAVPLRMKASEAAPRPNILFIILDDWGGETAVGPTGNPWIETPNMDRVAREGVRFNSAFTSNPKCSPCRATILTGRNSWQLKEAVSHRGVFPAGFDVFPDLLEAAGYRVGLTGKGWSPGNYRTAAGRTRNPAGPSFDLKEIVPVANGIKVDDYAGNFAAFLEDQPENQPFCFWMGFREPHRPYELGSGVLLGKRLEDVVVPDYLPDTPVVRNDLLDYAVEVEWADTQIGKALALLEERGELERTLVVVTSDHGMPFPRVKGQIYEASFHLPLAMRWGDEIKPGRVVEDFINARDFAPTFLEIGGVTAPAQMTGSSLLSILRSERSGWIEGRESMLIGKERHDIGRPHDWGYPVRALRTPEFLFVQNFHPERWPAGNPETDFTNCDPGPTKEEVKRLGGYFQELALGKRPGVELYRITRDPDCLVNLAANPIYADTVEQMQTRMLSMLQAEGDPRALGHAEIFDTYHYTGRRDKGYETWLAKQHIAP